jgi:hypothetical protein
MDSQTKDCCRQLKFNSSKLDYIRKGNNLETFNTFIPKVCITMVIVCNALVWHGGSYTVIEFTALCVHRLYRIFKQEMTFTPKIFFINRHLCAKISGNNYNTSIFGVFWSLKKIVSNELLKNEFLIHQINRLLKTKISQH